RDGAIAIWDGVTSHTLAMAPGFDRSKAVLAFDASASHLAIADGHNAAMWNLADGQLQWSQPVAGAAKQILVTGGRICVVTGLDSTSFDDRKVWLVSGERAQELGPVRRIAQVDADRFLAIEDARATLRAATGEPAATYEIAGITAFASSNDGARFAFSLTSGVIELMAARDGKRIGLLTGHTTAVQQMAFSPDG